MLRTALLASVAIAVIASPALAQQADTASGAPAPSLSPSPVSTPPAGSAPVASSAPATGPTPGPAPIPAPQSGALGEIVVTAQRQSENLQRAAVSVDAVTGGDLTANGVVDPTTLSNLVPGFFAAPAGGGSAFYFIRGVGNFTANPYSETAVAVNLDNVYLGLATSAASPFYDLERVEVVKGPQGTLYGRNATGGAVNVIPEKPQLGSTSGYVSASYGNYDAYGIDGAVNVSVGDRSALRISADFLGHSGYLYDGTSNEDTKAGRIQFLTRPIPNLSIRISADYADLGGAGEGAQYLNSFAYNRTTGGYVVTPSNIPAQFGLYSTPSQNYIQQFPAFPAGRNLGPLSPYPFLNNKLYGVNAEINYDTSLGRLTLIPAWRPSTISDLNDAAGFLSGTREDDEQYSTELRFTGKRISIFDYTFGSLYFHQRQKGVFGAALGSIGAFSSYSDDTDSYAGFARVTAHLTDQLRLVGGVRYTSDQKTFNGSVTDLVVLCVLPSCHTAPLVPFSFTANGQTAVPVPPAVGAIEPIGLTGALSLRTGFAQQTNLDTDRATYRGAIEYDVLPRSLLYASIETGYRSGGFNLAVGIPTYLPEYITAYTIGAKNRFLDNRLELNLEGFVWKYRNQQIAHLGLDLAGNDADFTQNVGRSTNQGGEVEVRYLLTPDTVVTSNIQYLEATYDQFNFQAPTSGGLPPFTGCRTSAVPNSTTLVNVNCSGEPSFQSPKWTLNFGLQQTVRVSTYKIVGNVDTQYLDSRFVGFEYQPAEYAPSVWQTNAQLTLTPDYGKWALSLFAVNLENNRYLVHAVVNTTANVLTSTNANPRTYGIRASVKF